jgi:serine/threonine-protein kinase
MVSPRSDLESLLETLAAFEATMVESPRESIRRRRRTTGVSEAMKALRQRQDATEALSFESVLGEGGMGTVHLAEQCSVGRHVAVKQLREQLGDDSTLANSLLREGWVMAMLEHPNIPPVYDVMLDKNGSPLVLLKRIEGDQWARLIDDEEAVRERLGEELLPWNLDVLDKVCHALSYAHSKKIVHRDLKPENIMIGAFDEVYVLDWGIAAALEKDPDGRLPFIGDSQQPAGTPCFMAPEQLKEETTHVDERTDVYLIGGMLYEALTGGPPHSGKDMKTIVESIVKSEPVFPADAPAALVDICKKAMQANPEDRYANVEQLRQAMRHYLKHRASQILTEEALERLGKLRELADAPPTPERSSEMASLFSECRFAFRQALTAFPDDKPARQGLSAAAEVMLRSALHEEKLGAAQSFAEEVEEVSPELKAEIEALVAQNAERKKRLNQLERQHNPELGKGKRVVLMAAFAVVVGVASYTAEKLRDTAIYDYPMIVAWQSFLLVGFLVLFPRLSLEETEKNRLIAIVFTSMFLAELIATLVGWRVGMNVDEVILLDSAVWLMAGTVTTLALGWIYLPILIACVVGMAIIGLYPSEMIYGTATIYLTMAINVAIVYKFKIKPRSFLRDS